MDMDRVRLMFEDGADRVKRDPGYAIKLAAGVILCLTGFILFLVEAKRSDGVQGSNYVIGFPLRDEAKVEHSGMQLPAATICPAVSLDVAGSTGLGQLTNMQCYGAGYDPVPMPPVSLQSIIVKKTDFTTDKLANYACWNVNADLKFVARLSSQTIKCDGYFSNLEGLPEAEAAVTYYDPRANSLDRTPSVDQFLWHSLHATAMTSMYIEPKELVFLNGQKDWCERTCKTRTNTIECSRTCDRCRACLLCPVPILSVSLHLSLFLALLLSLSPRLTTEH